MLEHNTHVLHVVLVRAVEIRGARHEERHRLGDGLEDSRASVASGDLARGKLVHQGHHVRRGACDGVGERLRLVRVGRLPRSESALPRIILGRELSLALAEEVVGVRRDVEQLAGRQAEGLTAAVLVLDASFAVRSASARDLVDALANNGLANNQRRLACGRI